MFAESLKVHEEINEITTQAIVVKPFLVFGYGERPLAPITVRKAESDIVGKAVIFKK